MGATHGGSPLARCGPQFFVGCHGVGAYCAWARGFGRCISIDVHLAPLALLRALLVSALAPNLLQATAAGLWRCVAGDMASRRADPVSRSSPCLRMSPVAHRGAEYVAR